MKKNLLPRMQKMKLSDKRGKEFQMAIELRRKDQLTYVFLSDSHHLGDSHLAQDAMYFLDRLATKLNLDRQHTHFYRHIYQEQTGSMFGRFQVDWRAQNGPSYKFRMLTNIDDLQSVDRILKESTAVPVQDHLAAQKRAS